MLVNNKHLTELNAPIQRIKARVELYKGSTLTAICNCGEVLRDFTLERTGENKFFGFGICQKLHGTLIDIHKTLDISKENTVEAVFGVGEDFIYPFPKFYVQEFKRDEVSGSISFSAYDILYKAENYTFADLALGENYTLEVVAAACANILQVPMKFINVDDNLLDTIYDMSIEGSKPNFTGKESVRRVLDAIAEMTQTVYYIDSDWNLVFRRLNPAEEPVITIDRGQYASFTNEGDRRLKNIMSVTEGEDNVHTEGTGEGSTQFLRDNPFLTLRNDIGSLLDQMQANVGGITLAQFDTTWTGNYLLEIGDKLAFETEDSTITSYLLDDTITFEGAMMQFTRWAFKENEGERASNPTTIGEALNDTYIRVDKANQRIDMVASKAEANESNIAAIRMDTESITASVTEVKENIQTNYEEFNGELVTVKNQVEMAMTSEDVSIEINKVIDNGVKKVETSTGFTFNEVGLTIEKSNSEMKTQITEDGMKIYRNNDEVLTVNNAGVNAENLHATTYLIIGGTSRFQDSDDGKMTGCFWIGN
jgi:hypothetical protein